jgi:hypothetical protein
MVKHDDKASFIWLPNFLKYNKPESPNVVRSWPEAFDLLPECSLKFSLFQHVKDYAETLTEGFREAFAQVFAKGMANQEQEQEQEQEVKPSDDSLSLTSADDDLIEEELEEEKPEAKQAKSTKRKSVVDPRFVKLVDSFHVHYPKVNNGASCPWSAAEGKQAKELLASLGDSWTSEMLDRCVQFKLWSENKPCSERPAVYLAQLTRYYEAPLDAYGKPDLKKLDRWLGRQSRGGEASIGMHVPAMSAPIVQARDLRVWNPSPKCAELLSKLTDPWTVILGKVAEAINPHTYETWLRPTKFAGINGSVLVFDVPTSDFAHVAAKFADPIFQAIEKLGFPITDVQISQIQENVN